MTKRRRVRFVHVLLFAVVGFAWLIVLFIVSGNIAMRQAWVVSWSKDQKPMTYPDRFYILLFPKPTSSNCELIADLNRAVIERFDRVQRSVVEVYVDNAPLSVDASCLSFLPPEGRLQTLVDNLVAQFKLWGSEITDWTSATAIERVLPGGKREIRFTLHTENGLETSIYETDGTYIAPIRAEVLSGAAVGINSAMLFFTLVLVHIAIVGAIVIVWLYRKWRRSVIGLHA